MIINDSVKSQSLCDLIKEIVKENFLEVENYFIYGKPSKFLDDLIKKLKKKNIEEDDYKRCSNFLEKALFSKIVLEKGK